jgi:type IX secretion system PorP/SprF family membrane protein
MNRDKMNPLIKHRYSIVIAFLLLMQFDAFSQIESMYSLYRFNPQVIAPMYVGGSEQSELSVINRQQWIGIEGAPKTTSLTANFKWKEKNGFGLLLLSDAAGPMQTMVIGGDLAYHVKLNTDWTMSSGIRLALANLSLNFSGMRLISTNDEVFGMDRSTGFKPNAGWGISFHKRDGVFFNFSMPRILKYEFDSNQAGYKDVAYLFGMIGTQVKASNKVILHPSVLIRMANEVPINWDINLMARLDDKLDVGVNYRVQDSFGIRLGMQASRKFYVGYVYELPISQISKASSQSHEFGLKYSFGKTQQ